MLRTLLLASLVSSMSLGCTLENGQGAAEGVVADDEGELLPGGVVLEPGSTGALDRFKSYRQRFDLALTSDDARTCASFAKVTLAGTWTSFSNFPSADPAIRDKRCAVIFAPHSYGTRATVEDLGLNCRERLSARERRCSNFGMLCPTTAPIVMHPPQPSGVPATEIPSQCVPTTKGDVIGPTPGELFTRTYTGGCTSCGTITGGMLYLNWPNDIAYVTYNVGGAPHMVGFHAVAGPITYDLGSGASGPVMVSH